MSKQLSRNMAKNISFLSCRFFMSCLSTCKKSKSYVNPLNGYWRLKNNLISPKHFQPRPNIPFYTISRQNEWYDFPKKSKNPVFISFLTIFGYFCPTGIFPKNPGSVTYISIWHPNNMQSFGIKLVNQFQENRRTDGRTDDRRTKGRTERRTDRP